MALEVNQILGLFRIRGAAMYGGETVSQLAHALQCAQLAEEANAPAELVAAGLLHDVGYLLCAQQSDAGRHADDLHQFHPLLFLRGVFPDAVLEPIRLHVEAKRYLCHAEPAYQDALSPASKHTLVLQGGPHSALEAKMFLARPYADDAVRLRRWDDRAKNPDKSTPDLDHFAQVLERCAFERCSAQGYALGTRWT